MFSLSDTTEDHHFYKGEFGMKKCLIIMALIFSLITIVVGIYGFMHPEVNKMPFLPSISMAIALICIVLSLREKRS